MFDIKVKGSIGRIIIMLLVLSITIIGGTFAWFTYKSRESALVLSIGDINDSRVIIEPYQIRETLVPTNSYTGGVYSQITAINNNSNKLVMNLFYKVNQIDELLINNGLRYTIVSSDSKDGEYKEVDTGDFTGIKNNKLKILNTEIESNKTTYYRVYLWLDTNAGNQVAIQNSVLDVELNGKINRAVNKPVLDEGMVPVVIYEDGTVMTTSEDNLDWYDYENQKWANIVLVNENASGSEGSKSREYYLNNPGIEVLESDILAYYVWIPRYKYKIWTTGVSSAGKEQEIDIVFESRYDEMSLGTNVGEYRSHPAFWWDNDNDSVYDEGEMLPGIWVGKFETTGSATQPTVKPNTASLTNQTLSAQFNTSLLFAGGSMNTSTGKVTFGNNNTYGLTDKTNSHMMKNSEWGAVAYLSYSTYGINDEVRINNYYASSKTLTGCGATSANATESTTCGISYSTPSTENNTYPQSTTGNITGVFDMSGGAWEYVMGNYNTTTGSSGFSTYPESKYYDLYTTLDISTACKNGICYGHALSEVSGWHNNTTNFIYDNNQWFIRGGYLTDTTNTGVFRSSYSDGNSYFDTSWRSVLIPKMNYTVNFDANGGVLENSMIYEMINYSSSGEYKFNIPYNGEYQLEVWGAQGGTSIGNGKLMTNGGYGGYSKGNIYLNSNEMIYINVGGKGGNGVKLGTAAGGYNGGGSGSSDGADDECSGGGGGASHMARKSGLLSSLSTELDKILLVAGGGGGASYTYSAGHGGGIYGGTTSSTSSSYPTQTSGYAFGKGQNGSGVADSDGVGGGGGGYYGGYSNNVSTRSSGTGGSGYIGNVLLTDKYMYCYNCSTSNEESTMTYKTTNVSSDAISNYAKSGNGAAKISFLGILKDIAYGYKYGNLPTSTRDGYVFVGWYTEPEGGTRVTEDTVVDILENYTLYAHWEKSPVLHFNTNGGSLVDISYTSVGDYEFVVPHDGEYQIELWGAQGGNYDSSNVGGYGGYTSGRIYLNEGEKLFTYIGGTTSTYQGGYNGGAPGGNGTDGTYRGGGGATDIRLINGEWNDFNSLKSRIMVAAGGAGSGYYFQNPIIGGSGGGLVGNTGTHSACKSSTALHILSTAGTQTSGGLAINNGTTLGYFGYSTHHGGGYGTGGGSGYYGGGSSNASNCDASGGAGGSSFISGHNGCDAILESSTESNIIHSGQTNHYSNYVFDNTIMIDGGGYNWTNVKENLQQMPNPNGGYYESGVGHSGDGVARISQTTEKKVIYGYRYGSLPTPTREGYTFVGWYTELEGGTKVTENTIANKYGDINLYARWESSNMNIVYSVNGGNIESSTTDGNNTYNWSTNDDKIYLNGQLYKSNISGSQTINLLNYNDSNFMNMNRSGYGVLDEKEWICLSGCKSDNMIFSQDIEYKISDFCDNTKPSCDVILGVNWVKKYTVTYDVNGGVNAPESQMKYHGVTINISSLIPSNGNYTFMGWSTDKNATSATYYPENEFTVNENTILYAIWSDFEPLTSYSCANGNSGSEPYDMTYTGNCTVINDEDGNWRIKFLTSGTFTSSAFVNIDTFLVGGGGKGGSGSSAGGGGGGGGYTITEKNILITPQAEYEIVIGASTKNTTAFNFTAKAGSNGTDGQDKNAWNASGGAGSGSGGRGGGWDGSYIGPGGGGGAGVFEFGEEGATRYGGGGGGGTAYRYNYGGYGNGGYGGAGGGGNGEGWYGSSLLLPTAGSTNTGGGGGGGSMGSGRDGGSGIVIIRNARY